MGILNEFSLKDQVIVITGATGILGEAFVSAVAEAGAKVVIMGQSEEKANERKALAENLGSEALIVIGNVLNEEDMLRAKEEILAKFGTIDGLVNAAGGNITGSTLGPEQDLFSLDMNSIKKAIELNLYGTMIPTHILGQVIAEQGKGSIVNISSLAADRSLTRVLGYTIAKNGIEGYTKWMATELSLRYGDHVRMNAIAPGVFLTAQNKNLLMDDSGNYTLRAQKFIDHTPFSRLGHPTELQGTLVYLLSNASAFVNGETIFVDGGFSAWSGI
ncbi:D-mannonate oxidoreductase [Chryseobacterium piperi]|uniref:D-mannonate oxidoreductase n=1 Tax=Chryseobacterium piperi TaxID=558152 RepID=A0A086B9P4_9FLAO|nr:SDR family oxidoreductase [Chryseobacterium piperi]ASW73593.1 D-mannonate oxidoreductase [Chryseobacterium piperi]KFF25658.1 D-mannonate oxidoreductase [Chryseobacterium piperi]